MLWEWECGSMSWNRCGNWCRTSASQGSCSPGASCKLCGHPASICNTIYRFSFWHHSLIFYLKFRCFEVGHSTSEILLRNYRRSKLTSLENKSTRRPQKRTKKCHIICLCLDLFSGMVGLLFLLFHDEILFLILCLKGLFRKLQFFFCNYCELKFLNTTNADQHKSASVKEVYTFCVT